MTAIEETMGAIQALTQQLGQSANTAASAAKSAAEGRSRAAALGAQVSIQQFAQLHDGLTGVQTHIVQLVERVGQLMTLARAVQGG